MKFLSPENKSQRIQSNFFYVAEVLKTKAAFIFDLDTKAQFM